MRADRRHRRARLGSATDAGARPSLRLGAAQPKNDHQQALDAAYAIETAKTAQKTPRERPEQERRTLVIECGAERLRQIGAYARLADPRGEAFDARAAAARRGADELRGLPIDEARRLEAEQAVQEQV